jgi:hypothetical protein
MRACQPVADGYVERDGVKVHDELFGAGEPTVLLLPTWSIVHSRLWKMQIPYLARHCRVLTFDPRGNGRSDRPTEPKAYAEQEFAADALAVMDATQTPRAVVVGFSMGAHRGLLLAANHPERVQAAAFIGGSYQGGGEPVPERTVYSWEDELDTDEGWAKHNQHYWLRDYPGYLEFFFSRFCPGLSSCCCEEVEPMSIGDFPGGRWQGQWIAAEVPDFAIDPTSLGGDLPSAGFSRVQFRRTFELATDMGVPDRVPLRVSAGSRYLLWVNDVEVGRGPIRPSRAACAMTSTTSPSCCGRAATWWRCWWRTTAPRTRSGSPPRPAV